ncbi:SRPBCC family protein [Gordonia sp. (in: high G+C Gram-positive bacteria)]|uniref:SRPBCC family protein n=1 Tax=unclassified Gordonia (in: high G+C Gram-positive bacteria) TaxID=2657482 RepID=UPI00262FE10C|nr:SRPBCC family protein [Gordonia sp. (in: high G+C Gram-positive bacteria)]
MEQHEEVTVTIAAPADAVWSLISDVTRIGEFSPETFEAQWLGEADGPVAGARFRGHVRRNEVGPIYWTTCTVLECEPERVFTFGVGSSSNPVTRWGYRLTPSPDGASVDVTETFDFTSSWWAQPYWLLLGGLRRRRVRQDMLRTLERMRAVAER